MADNASREQRQALFDKPTSFLLAQLSALTSTRHDVKKDRSDLQRDQEQRTLQSSCTEGDSFAITSSVFPSTEGCFSNLGNVADDGNVIYESGSVAVLSLPFVTSTSSETLVSAPFTR